MKLLFILEITLINEAFHLFLIILFNDLLIKIYTFL